MKEAAVLLVAMYETITLTYSSPNRPMDDDVGFIFRGGGHVLIQNVASI